MDLAPAEAEIRHVFGDTPITEASIGAAPPDILVKLSGSALVLRVSVGEGVKEKLSSIRFRIRLYGIFRPLNLSGIRITQFETTSRASFRSVKIR